MNKNLTPLALLGGVVAFFGFFFVVGFVHGVREGHYRAHRMNQFLAVQRGDAATAIDEDTAMMQLFPDRFAPYMLRGMAYSSRGRHLLAIADFTKSLDRFPNDRDRVKEMSGWSDAYTLETLHYDRAVDEEKTGDDAGAITDIDRALHIDPNMQDAHLVRAQAHLGLKEYRKAANDFDWSIQRGDNHLDHAYYLSAQAQEGCGNHLRAISDTRKAIAARPEIHFLWSDLGWYQFKAGQFQDAIATDQKALAFADQKSALPAFNLGLCYAVIGDEAHARAAYELGLKMPSNQQVMSGAQEDIADELKAHPQNPVLLEAQHWMSGG